MGVDSFKPKKNPKIGVTDEMIEGLKDDEES